MFSIAKSTEEFKEKWHKNSRNNHKSVAAVLHKTLMLPILKIRQAFFNFLVASVKYHFAASQAGIKSSKIRLLQRKTLI